MRNRIALALAASGILVTTGCTGVTPNIRPSSKTATGVPTLVAVACDADGVGAPLPVDYVGETYTPGTSGELGIAGILLSGLITKGVDLLGSKLAARGEEKTRTLEAQLNISDPAQQITCFDFARGDDLRIRFAMLPPISRRQGADPTLDRRYVSFNIIALKYAETVNLEESGTRGLSMTFEILKPAAPDPVSQTISLRNVQVGSAISIPFAGNPFTSGYVANPFVRVETAEETKARAAKGDPILKPDLPFTLRARLTEIRNANELYKLGGGVIQDKKDDLSAAILKAIGLKETEDEEPDATGGNGNPDEGQPPADNAVDGEPEDAVGM
jgi:hypothetical protein